MKKHITKSSLAIAVILGSTWGFMEVVLGAGLQTCAQLVSGSLMTGVALFFVAAVWVATRNYLAPVLTVLIASLFKLFDAVLLSLPVIHGAVANPIFAFWMEGLAFIILILIFRHATLKNTSSRALLGGASALIAVALFPLVKFATGIPACVYPNTAVPLSIYFGPVAIVFSAFTIPLAFHAGERIGAYIGHIGMQIRYNFLRNLVSPLAMAVLLALIAVFRVIMVS